MNETTGQPEQTPIRQEVSGSACTDLLSGSLVDRFLDVLNRAVTSDVEAMTAIIESRVPCNQALADDPTIQCGGYDGEPYTVGPLGLINGLCGIDPNTGYGAIQMVIDDETGQIRHFERCPKANLS